MEAQDADPHGSQVDNQIGLGRVKPIVAAASEGRA
jgi:hypothetical protein